MPIFLDPHSVPLPLNGQTDLYGYLESSVFFEPSPIGREAVREELFAVWEADMQIMNGGIAQFLLNSSGDLAEQAILGFRRFGVPELGDLLDQSIRSLGSGEAPSDTEERRQWIAAALGDATDHRALTMKLTDELRPYSRRYYTIKKVIDSERGGQGFLWRICCRIEAHRDILFPAL